ncbi:TIM-barrel domain-containing protein [Ferroplasma sp.]|uniref:glycoside hydrolase family 31 protein n=1 Tax=Ferroplasma sp. TaxID=2591003 RepID=UPI002617F41D|nr:TIM-barrel domain-containing protein [Ferroplasma sp.]
MNNLNDFNIKKLFENESFSSAGFIKEVVKNNGISTFIMSKMKIQVKLYNGVGLKVDIDAGDGFSGLSVPHNAPTENFTDEYTVIFPHKGDKFSMTVKKGDETIFSPFAPQDQLGFLNLGDELYELLTTSTENGMIRISFKIPSNYGIYGMGENFTTFLKNGKTLYTFPQDNYCLGAEEVYKGVPFFLTNAGIGIVFPEYAPMKFDFGQTMEGLIMITSPQRSLSFYLIFGTPEQIVREFLTMFGIPELPPEWSFGMWVSRWAGIGYRNVEDVSEILDTFQQSNIPLDVICMDPQWIQNYVPGVTQACEFQWNRSAFTRDDDLGNFLKEKGKKLCLWVNPYVLLNGTVIREMKNCLLKDSKGEIALVSNQDRNPNKPDRGMVDFSRIECSEKYTSIIENLMIRSNADAVMTDFGETVPTDSIDQNENPGYLIRNLIGDLYQHSAFEGVKKAKGQGIVWGRSGSLLSHNYPIQWGGDSNSTWEGMRTALRSALSASISGTLFTAFDTGGFAGKPGPLLYIRWVAMGAMFSHFKLHGTTPREPWNYDQEIVKAFGELVRLRYRLIPYIISEAKISIEIKKPLVRPLILEFPLDTGCQFIDDEYMLGGKLLVAPIFNEAGKRSVYIPKGKWIDFYDKTRVDGPIWITVEKPISKIPIFIKYGETIEMTSGNSKNVKEALSMTRKKLVFES